MADSSGEEFAPTTDEAIAADQAEHGMADTAYRSMHIPITPAPASRRRGSAGPYQLPQAQLPRGTPRTSHPQAQLAGHTLRPPLQPRILRPRVGTAHPPAHLTAAAASPQLRGPRADEGNIATAANRGSMSPPSGVPRPSERQGTTPSVHPAQQWGSAIPVTHGTLIAPAGEAAAQPMYLVLHLTININGTTIPHSVTGATAHPAMTTQPQDEDDVATVPSNNMS